MNPQKSSYFAGYQARMVTTGKDPTTFVKREHYELNPEALVWVDFNDGWNDRGKEARELNNTKAAIARHRSGGK